jgi:hypothetical protein
MAPFPLKYDTEHVFFHLSPNGGTVFFPRSREANAGRHPLPHFAGTQLLAMEHPLSPAIGRQNRRLNTGKGMLFVYRTALPRAW